MTMSCQYALVEFEDSSGHSVSVVPVNWLNGEFTYWAPYSNQERFNKSVMSAETPSKSWEKYHCRVLQIKASYEKARTQLRRAEDTSDLGSEAENQKPRKRRCVKPFDGDIDDECDEPPPIVQKSARKPLRMVQKLGTKTSFTKPFLNHLSQLPVPPKPPVLVSIDSSPGMPSTLSADLPPSTCPMSSENPTSRMTPVGSASQSPLVSPDASGATSLPATSIRGSEIPSEVFSVCPSGGNQISNMFCVDDDRELIETVDTLTVPENVIEIGATTPENLRTAVRYSSTARTSATPAGGKMTVMATMEHDAEISNSPAALTASSMTRKCSRQSSKTDGTSRADGITLTLLLELKAEMRDLRDQLGNIQDLLHTITGLGNVSDDDSSLTLPIKNLSELRNVEEQMMEDSVVRQKLLKKLSVCGGKTVRKAVRRMIDVLLSNEVQRSLNWSGLNGKQAFRKLECCEILQEAVRRNKRTASATNDDIKEQVQLYLHGASDRCGGRVERLKKAKLRMTAQDGEPDSD